MSAARYALAAYQQRAQDALASVIRKVVDLHERLPGQHRDISLGDGVMLLESPTGSGKTLTLGRTMESLKAALPRPVVWLWFAPFSGLVAQTRDALGEQCSGLRLRDITKDRETKLAQDGDVYVMTWATVATDKKEARKVRQKTETVMSFDEMVLDLRERNFLIGVVVDEAHLNFGANAKAAADFYLDVLQPDFTILATATPNDAKLVEFENKAKISVKSRIVIPRSDVVAEGLNKVGLKLGLMRFNEADAAFIDPETALLTAAWQQNKRIVARLEERGIGLTPLMMVQVENDGAGDPVGRVRKKLENIGVPDGAIASHTSGEPDPDFHTLAYDPDKQVLIFKVAAATGFDAPRAWTLASVRPGIGTEFGLQVVGRIMRVHRQVRPIHGKDPLLDSGSVFLLDGTAQQGIRAAAEALNAVKSSVSIITDRLDITVIGPRPLAGPAPAVRSAPASSASQDSGAEVAGGMSSTPREGDHVCSGDQDFADQIEGARFVEYPDFQPPSTEIERLDRLGGLIGAGIVSEAALGAAPADQVRFIAEGESLLGASQLDLFAEDGPVGGSDLVNPVQGGLSVTPQPRRPAHAKLYHLRSDIELPSVLKQEVHPDPVLAAGLVDEIAVEFCKDKELLTLLSKRRSKVDLDLQEIFAPEQVEHASFQVALSPALIAERAQLAMNLGDHFDRREVKRAIVRRLMSVVEAHGLDHDEHDIRRTVDLAMAKKPDALREAVRLVTGRHMQIRDYETPPYIEGPIGLRPARLNAYGVFPDGMNGPETSLAEALDSDDSGLVKWWIRNVENTRWAVKIMRPSGRPFYPDFIVGIAGRKTPDCVALIEVKDDGKSGRLHSEDNREKIQSIHAAYRNVVWTYLSEGGVWTQATWDEATREIRGTAKFEFTDLVIVR